MGFQECILLSIFMFLCPAESNTEVLGGSCDSEREVRASSANGASNVHVCIGTSASAALVLQMSRYNTAVANLS